MGGFYPRVIFLRPIEPFYVEFLLRSSPPGLQNFFHFEGSIFIQRHGLQFLFVKSPLHFFSSIILELVYG